MPLKLQQIREIESIIYEWVGFEFVCIETDFVIKYFVFGKTVNFWTKREVKHIQTMYGKHVCAKSHELPLAVEVLLQNGFLRRKCNHL